MLETSGMLNELSDTVTKGNSTSSFILEFPVFIFSSFSWAAVLACGLMRVHSQLHSRECPSACSELWCQVEAVYKVCITKGHNKVCYRVPPQITKNRAETSRYSIIPIPSSLKQPCIPIWSRVDDAEDIFFPSTKNSSCPSPPPPKKTKPSHYLTYTEHCCYTESLLFWYLTWPPHRIRLFGTPETCWIRSHHYPRRCIVYSWDWKAGQPDISHIKEKQGSKKRLHVDADE